MLIGGGSSLVVGATLNFSGSHFFFLYRHSVLKTDKDSLRVRWSG